MRNLKRALSLLLAAAMLIGMMVVGASAAGSLDDFSDKDEIVNQDAVSLLTILGVIEGKEDGSYFDPTGNVTRAEMAKMIATILNQGADIDGLYTGMNTGLTDVSGHWAESYINYCYSLGIIAGRGDGTFDPGATVTGNEAAKMLLVAVGYDANIEGLTGNDWAIRTAALASNLGIFDNLTVATSNELNRDNAALLVYNALDIEMIQRYENGYAIVYNDYRTLLSNKYGVYRLQGVVIGNEWARLENTGSDASLAEGKTRLGELRLVDSSTVSTRPGVEDGLDRPDTTFNVSTPVEYLGQTVTMYVRNTTVLANSEVLGVYLKDGANTVLTTAENANTMDGYLRGTGLDIDKDTAYYVNYGVMDSQADATKAMSFEEANPSRFESVNGKVNAYGVEMTVIDNDEDGMVDYVLYLQETLSHVAGKNVSDETTTLTAFNGNKAIDDEDIVTEADLAVGDLVLAVSYGGRYYVSDPEVITGEMDAYTSNKAKEQTITVNGTDYHPSFIQYAAYTADNTYEFNILNCDREDLDGVQFDIEYDFILDSNGNVIAYQPSEQGLYDYALVLDSAYDPGLFASGANGQVKVLLPDGTEKTFNLNFSASAENVGEQLNKAANDADDLFGVQQLKALLGTAYRDNTTTAPWNTPIDGSYKGFVDQDINADTVIGDQDDYRTGNAKGYVIGYSLNADETELTITSIVGSTRPLVENVLASDIDGVVGDSTADDRSYDSGDGRLYWTKGSTATDTNSAIDLNTVAFYYDFKNAQSSDRSDRDAASYGVAIGYKNMSDVAEGIDVVGKDLRNASNLAATVVFDAEGVQAEKDYLYLLGYARTNSDGTAVMNVVYMNGDLGQITIDRDDYRNYFRSDSAYEMAYAYTTGSDGITDLTFTNFPTGGHVSSNVEVVYGYAWDLKNGTIEVYENENKTNRIGYYSFNSETVWNVEDEDGGAEGTAVRGNFSDILGSDVVIVTNKDDGNGTVARAVFIRDMLDNMYSGVITTTGAQVGVPTTNTVGDFAKVDVTGAASRSTLSFEWFMQTNQVGNYVSLADNANFKATTTTAGTTTTSTLSVLNANVLPAGTHNFRVQVTYTETGKEPTVVNETFAVTVGTYTAKSIVYSTANDFAIYADSATTPLTEAADRSGVRVTIPDGTTTVYIQNTNSAWTPGDHYTFSGNEYTVDADGCIAIPVSGLGTETRISAGNFTKLNVLTYNMGGATYTSEDAPAPVYSVSATESVTNGPATTEGTWQFIGWLDSANTALYAAGDTVDMSTGDVTLTAVYLSSEVTATGTVDTSSQLATLTLNIATSLADNLGNYITTSGIAAEVVIASGSLTVNDTSTNVTISGSVVTPTFDNTTAFAGIAANDTITLTVTVTYADAGTNNFIATYTHAGP